MMTKMKPVPKGGILYFTSGARDSDYYVQGVFKAIEELDGEALWKEYTEAHPPKKPFSIDRPSFINWLFTRGLIEPLESWEMWEDWDDDFAITHIEGRFE